METLANKIKCFIVSVIKQREFLIKTDKNHKDKFTMEVNIETLKSLLEANNYLSDRQMAGFFNRHSDRILSLMPGTGSKDYDARLKEFDEIKNLCITILT